MKKGTTLGAKSRTKNEEKLGDKRGANLGDAGALSLEL
jgi:hypothetical protein